MDKSKYITPQKIFWFIIIIYFVIAPLQSLRNDCIANSGALDGFCFSKETIMLSELLVFLFCLPYFLSNISHKSYKATQYISRIELSSIEFYFILFLTIFAFFLYIISQGGFENLLLPRRMKNQIEGLKAWPVIAGAIYMMLSFIILSSILRSKAIKNIFIRYAIASWIVISMGLCFNPVNTPRFTLIAAWLPIVLIFLNGKISDKNFYIFSIISILFLMPILSITTRDGLSGLESYTFDISDFRLQFIDVFDTLLYAIDYVDKNDYGFGENLLGTLSSLLPSSVWIDRPLPAGIRIGMDLFRFGAVTDNLSFFIGGDFYLDFGLIGVLLGGWIFGKILNKIIYFSIFISNQNILNYVAISLLPISLRGPFSVGILANVLSEILAFFMITKIVIFIRILNKASK